MTLMMLVQLNRRYVIIKHFSELSFDGGRDSVLKPPPRNMLCRFQFWKRTVRLNPIAKPFIGSIRIDHHPIAIVVVGVSIISIVDWD